MLRGEEYNPEQFQNNTPSSYGKYKKENEKYFVDNFESDKKRQHQNYSNLFNTKLGDPESRSQYSNLKEQKHTLELNVNKRESARSNGYGYQGNLAPSVHYSEFKNANNANMEESHPKNYEQMMHDRTQRMMESLRKESGGYPGGEEPRRDVNNHEDDYQSRNYYKKMMGVGKNIINNTEDAKMFNHNPDEKYGEVVVRDYKLQGYKYDLMKSSDKQLRGELLKEGYHVVSLQIVQDPISGNPNGQLNVRVRLQIDREGRFEQFIQQHMNWVIMGKK